MGLIVEPLPELRDHRAEDLYCEIRIGEPPYANTVGLWK